MTKLLLGASLIALLMSPAMARNIAVPANDPAALVSVPDTWKYEEIEYGYSATSPDKDVFFSVEYAGKNKIDAMMDNNTSWMKENGIDASVKPTEAEMDFGGLSGKVFRFDTKDENGPTRVDFVLLPGGKNRLIFLTLWGSEEERKNHSAEVEAIMSSVKALQ
jgi:opacity protein-like surface antigen